MTRRNQLFFFAALAGAGLVVLLLSLFLRSSTTITSSEASAIVRLADGSDDEDELLGIGTATLTKSGFSWINVTDGDQRTELGIDNTQIRGRDIEVTHQPILPSVLLGEVNATEFVASDDGARYRYYNPDFDGIFEYRSASGQILDYGADLPFIRKVDFANFSTAYAQSFDGDLYRITSGSVEQLPLPSEVARLTQNFSTDFPSATNTNGDYLVLLNNTIYLYPNGSNSPKTVLSSLRDDAQLFLSDERVLLYVEELLPVADDLINTELPNNGSRFSYDITSGARTDYTNIITDNLIFTVGWQKGTSNAVIAGASNVHLLRDGSVQSLRLRNAVLPRTAALTPFGAFLGTDTDVWRVDFDNTALARVFNSPHTIVIGAPLQNTVDGNIFVLTRSRFAETTSPLYRITAQ